MPNEALLNFVVPGLAGDRGKTGGGAAGTPTKGTSAEGAGEGKWADVQRFRHLADWRDPYNDHENHSCKLGFSSRSSIMFASWLLLLERICGQTRP
ncbi:hypothetical protein I350_06614 [Cryptococcus amylolentus CBS 6273]|uniref:Uncharacterized protein n=1 Tax=Cryptococcus amylolentus CBS 6273 TaxID=1296118 RepID=A0A1E3JLP1_9TREE|nr:hypothetical protein I350_06614 [Cryptococcus amylolentus CBS 6273]